MAPPPPPRPPPAGPVVDARGDPPPPAALDRAVAALVAGRAVVVPTDTVYGLAADPSRPEATEAVFALKQRPAGVPLAVLVADEAQALALVDDPPPAVGPLVRRFWPGGLTIVLRRRPGVDLALGEDQATVGLRCPAHPVPRSLAARVGPLATTSANRHGRPTPVTAAGVAEALGPGLGLVLDAGPCTGAPSTVVDCSGEGLVVLREGAVPAALVRAVAAGEP